MLVRYVWYVHLDRLCVVVGRVKVHVRSGTGLLARLLRLASRIETLLLCLRKLSARGLVIDDADVDLDGGDLGAGSHQGGCCATSVCVFERELDTSMLLLLLGSHLHTRGC